MASSQIKNKYVRIADDVNNFVTPMAVSYLFSVLISSKTPINSLPIHFRILAWVGVYGVTTWVSAESKKAITRELEEYDDFIDDLFF